MGFIQPPRRAYCSILTSDTIRRSRARKILSEVKVRALEENEQVIIFARDESRPIILANQETNSTARAKSQGYFYQVAFDCYVFLILPLQYFNLQVIRTTPNIMCTDLHVTQRSWALRSVQKFYENFRVVFFERRLCFFHIWGGWNKGHVDV